MKFLNDFKNLFAIVGVVSIIFWTCSAESTSDTTNVNPPQLTGGVYQVSHSGTLGYMTVLNNDTGVMKTYSRANVQTSGTGFYEWVETSTIPNGGMPQITFTH
jgi:hypothetical protein